MYNFLLNEYFIDNLGVPNEMTFDARYVKSDSTLYTLQDIEWDFDSD
jgi:hypothetical protein